ncbi:uncharacterized protein LOC111396752 [Olea europaea var. sylvestris]|uniref:uncharacterized protein LOC111396752 n=1 Tax=Olea europaea var. sylvestris TaxID=158386 RepID=UPI000C1D4FAB|nr:uncharacterized protein LOC111396752 [Olea europaea var. sylvestris]
MDSMKKMSFDSNWHWTNERHTDFLNSMEASFVRTMFEGQISRLDRYIPDTTESTQDLGKERRRRYSTSELNRRKKDKRTRLLSSQSDISSQDQVVPQVNNKRDDKENDET